MSRLYDVRHVTTYRYDEEVTASYGRAHLAPRDGAGQVKVHDEVTVAPQADMLRESEDFYGNRSLYIEVHTPHTELVVTAASRIRIDRPPPEPADPAAAGWERAVERVDALLDGAASDSTAPDQAAETIRVMDLRLPSRHVPSSPQVRAFAADVFTPGRPVWEAVRDLVRRIHDDFTYRSGVTSLGTTPAEVLQRRTGVCQDFAHLGVGVLRSVGLPARYVSGYLETSPPPGRPRLIGADASHAWLSVWLPGLGWVDLDPTNDTVVDESYVVTAWGRDYADVPPLKGVIYTEGSKTRLSVAVDVARVPDPPGDVPAPTST